MMRHLPAPLLARLRAYAAQHSLTLRDAILAILERGLADAAARARGGQARAEALSPDARRASAQHAARTRWQRP